MIYKGWVLEEHDIMTELKQMQSMKSVADQFLIEVIHAMQCGPSWYTRGESGLKSQVYLWIDRMSKALKNCQK